MLNNDFGMPLVRLVLDAVARPRNNSIQYSNCLVVSVTRSEPPAELDLEPRRDALPEPIEIVL